MRVFTTLFVAAAAYAISWGVFSQAPITTDENSYVFQAHNFLDGVISRPHPDFSDLLQHKMIIMDENVGWLSRYPPGHSLWLAPGVLIGNPYVAAAIGAGLGVWIILKSSSLLGGGFVIPALLVMCSPFYLFTYGTLLSHTSGLPASALMLLCYILWRRADFAGYALFSGLAWGWLCLNRTYTALWLAIPFAAHSIYRLLRKRDRTELLGACAFAGAAAAGALLLLLYNWLAVGSPGIMTYLYYDPTEGVGFGPRHASGIVIDHSFRRGLSNLLENLKLLDQWLFGFRGSGMVLAALALAGWRKPWTPLLLGCALSVWIGHIFFWFPGTPVTGPTYYFETLPYLMTAAALGVSVLWDRAVRLGLLRNIAGISAACLLAIAAGSFMLRTGREIYPLYRDRSQLIKLLRAAPPDSLALVQQGPHSDYVAFNPRGLESEPLAVRQPLGSNKAIARRFPNRKLFVLKADSRSELEEIEPDEVFDFVMAATHMSGRTGTNLLLSGHKVRAARADTDSADLLAFGRHVCVFPGRFAVHFDIEVSDCRDDKESLDLDVASQGGRRIHVKRLVNGNVGGSGVVVEFDADGYYLVEPRVFYSGNGNVLLRSISISEKAESMDQTDGRRRVDQQKATSRTTRT